MTESRPSNVSMVELKEVGSTDVSTNKVAASETKTEFPDDCCFQHLEGQRLPISKLEQREKRHNVQTVPRKCTDCFCFFVFLVFCLIWAAVAYVAIVEGDLWALTHGRDYQGRLCGKGPGVESQPLVSYPRLNQDIYEHVISLGINIAEFDITSLSIVELFSLNITSICVETCPNIGDVVCSYNYLATHGFTTPPAEVVLPCDNGDPFTAQALLGIDTVYAADNPFLCTNCWVASINSTNIFNRCLDIIYTTKTTDENCIYPSNLSLAADDPNCHTKIVKRTEISIEPSYDNPIASLLGSLVETVYGWCVKSTALDAKLTFFNAISILRLH